MVCLEGVDEGRKKTPGFERRRLGDQRDFFKQKIAGESQGVD